MPVDPFVVGLTGGIGSGKSTVADLFSNFGVAVIDTDKIAHALTSRHGRAIEQIRAVMGADLITPEGSLDRAATRNRVFSDSAARNALEAILHPLIKSGVDLELAGDDVQRAPYTMLVVPLLFETLSYRKRIHRSLLVDCAVSMQLERVQRRSSLNIEESMRIVEAQLPRALRLQLADDIIRNAESPGALDAQVRSMHWYYAQLANAAR
jgi:dephospho-CoA kinase